MKNLFTSRCLSIGLSRRKDNTIILCIDSDYSQSSRKSRLCVNEKRLSDVVENTWKSIKTKKLQSMSVSFGEIDWYDDMCDMYDTPVINIKRGLKKGRIDYHTHGSIPKDWSVNVQCDILDTTTKTPIIEVLKNVLGYHFTSDVEKKFTKKLVPFLQKKVTHFYYSED